MSGRRLLLILLMGAAAAAFSVGAVSALPDPCQVGVVAESRGLGFGVTSEAGATGVAWGHVSFKSPPSATVVVNLTAQTSNGWPVAILPASATVANAESVSFSVSAQAPAAAPAGDVGTLRVDARVRVNTFACTAPEPATFAMRVGRYIDVFGARIVNAAPTADAGDIPRAFDIEVQVRSNAPMRVHFRYEAQEGWFAQGPSAVEIDPSFTLIATESAHVSLSGRLRPGFTTFYVLVEGWPDGAEGPETPYAGRLGYTVFVQEPSLVPSPSPNPYVPLLLAVGAVSAVEFVLVRRRLARRRAAIRHLREVVTEPREEGHFAPWPPRSS